MADTNRDIQFLQNWLQAISEDFHCGVDFSFEDSFENIKVEVEKSFSLHADVSTNWKTVLELVNVFLSEDSKDLWVICYGIKAVYECHGLLACISSLNILNDIFEKYWNELHPATSRLARRAAPLNWLYNRLENILQIANFPNDNGETVAEFKNITTKLQIFLDDKLADLSPSFSSLLKQIPENNEKKIEPSDNLNANGINKQTSNVQTFQQQKISNLEPGLIGGQIPQNDLPQVSRALHEQAQRLALHFLQQDMIDWRVYLLHRTALWCTVIQLPQANAEGVTTLRPVPRDKFLTYNAAVDAKRFGEILPQLEQSAAKMPFWFDGHHMVVKCLEGLKANKALFFLQSILFQFIGIFPELITYKYHDGTPFASPNTASWLSSLKTNPMFGGASSSPVVKLNMPKHHADVEDKLSEAIATFNDVGFEEGLKQLGHISPSKSRSSICHGLLQARYCQAIGRPKSAVGILWELYGKLEEWNLLDWEPELSADILSLLISVADSQQLDIPSSMAKRLYWLNLETALATFEINK